MLLSPALLLRDRRRRKPLILLTVQRFNGVVLLTTPWFAAVLQAAAPNSAAPDPAALAPEAKMQAKAAPRLRTYLARSVPRSARHLDHGVLQVAAAGGFPHLYRLQLALGLLDHLSLGVSAHWLARENKPQWTPTAAVAFYRGRRIDVGAWYTQTLYPSARVDDDPLTPSFDRRDHWLLGTASFSNMWISGGLDFGTVRAREIDPSQDPMDINVNPSVIRWRLGGGLHLRAGTRRWGFTASMLAPHLSAELAFDLRFGLFELRKRGGWRPGGVVYATDRRAPFARPR